MSGKYYEFREARTVDELLQLWQLRYERYHESRLHDFVSETPLHIDLDGYETKALHFGVFKIEKGVCRAVGFHRPVFDYVTHSSRLVLDAASQIEGGLNVVRTAPPIPYSTISCSPQGSAIASLCRTVTENGGLIVESTKFGICPDESSKALVLRIIESAIAINLIYRNHDLAIQACTPTHAEFYKLYGYERIPGTEDFVCNGVPARCIMLDGRKIRIRVLPRLMQIAEAFAKTRKVCFNPEDPGNFYEPKAQTIEEHAIAPLAA